MLAPKAATSCPPFSSITPTNAAICLACMATRSGSVNLGSVSTSFTTTVSPRRNTSRSAAAKRADRPLSGKRCDTAGVFTPNDVLAVVELRVADTVHAQVFAQQPRGDFLHVERIAQRPQRIGEPEEEGLSLFAPQQEFARDISALRGEPDGLRARTRRFLGVSGVRILQAAVVIPDRRFRHIYTNEAARPRASLRRGPR